MAHVRKLVLVLSLFAVCAVSEALSGEAAPARRLAAGRLQAVQQAAQLPARAAGAAAVRLATPEGLLDRAEVNPQDRIERFLLLTAGGPLIVQVSLTLDGAPFRVPREKLVDELLAAADTDGNGTPTWSEALANRKFGYGQFNIQFQGNDEQRKQLLRYYDKNADGLVERSEARSLLAQFFGGPTFTLNPYFLTGQAAAAVFKLLDADGDGTISAEEAAAASPRLKSRDADDNDLVTQAELGGDPNQIYFQSVGANPAGAVPVAMLIGPAADPTQVFQAIEARYRGADGLLRGDDFSLAPSWLTSIDANQDGQFQAVEAAGLNTVPPHIELEANFGQTGDLPAGVRLKALAAELGDAEKIASAGDQRLSIHLLGVELTFAWNSQLPAYDFAASAKATITQLDADKNGYVEKSELKGNNQYYAQQFDNWDADGDGKLYAAEVEQAFDRQVAPMKSQISAAANREQDPLFTALDATGDGRVSLREMRAAASRLQTFDANGDGRLAAGEVPDRLTVNLSRGGVVYAQPFRSAAGGYVAGQAGAASPPGPEWFQRMDRNGDGDVTLREFLGTSDQFDRLDADHDGLVDPQEAAAAAQ